MQCLAAIPQVYAPFIQEEYVIGTIYKSSNGSEPLYVVGWPAVETLNYYGNTEARFIGSLSDYGVPLKGPLYLVTNVITESYLILNAQAADKDMQVLYQGKILALLHFGPTGTLYTVAHP